ncbi:hypothetical protein JOB18_049109 [Solea senegalensis]|uniref:Uncharacterized protein n=1 Tax=Solea senegalensis TaxID=28829 RepID=A0AAV6T238_SOLSE|nr:hypothetical protein JOB18_049109 [Solea senegalensis]
MSLYVFGLDTEILRWKGAATAPLDPALFGSLNRNLPVSLKEGGEEGVSHTPATIHPFYFLMELITQTAAQPLYEPPEVEHNGKQHQGWLTRIVWTGYLKGKSNTQTHFNSWFKVVIIQGQPSVYNIL